MAVTKFNSLASGEHKAQPTLSKSGLVFPVGRVHRIIKEKSQCRVGVLGKSDPTSVPLLD